MLLKTKDRNCTAAEEPGMFMKNKYLSPITWNVYERKEDSFARGLSDGQRASGFKMQELGAVGFTHGE